MTARSVAVGAACAALVFVGGLTACSNGEDLPTVAASPTTTDPAAARDLEPAAPPKEPAEIVDGLRSARESADFCAVLVAIDVAEPDADDRGGAIDVYRELATTTAGARAFLPAELRSDWEVVVTGTADAAAALEAHDGDLSDPDVEMALTRTAMVDAIRNVERYQLTSCPPPSAP
jgi:hypothetical protein